MTHLDEAAPTVGPRHPHGQDGSATGSWVLQVLVVLALLGLLGWEAVAIGATVLSLDTASTEVARTARDAYRSSDGSLDGAADAAADAAVTHAATVTEVSSDGRELTVTLERRAPTVLVHRIGPVAHLADRSATARVALEPS